MIFDKETELHLLESQPEWIQVGAKIEALQKDLHYWNNRLSKDPADWIAQKLDMIQKDLDLFQNILLFWASNYQKMKSVADAVERQIEAANKGADLLDLIDDLRTAYDYEYKENILLSQTFIAICEKKNIENKDKIRQSLRELAINTKKYAEFLKLKLENIIDE